MLARVYVFAKKKNIFLTDGSKICVQQRLAKFHNLTRPLSSTVNDFYALRSLASFQFSIWSKYLLEKSRKCERFRNSTVMKFIISCNFPVNSSRMGKIVWKKILHARVKWEVIEYRIQLIPHLFLMLSRKSALLKTIIAMSNVSELCFTEIKKIAQKLSCVSKKLIFMIFEIIIYENNF
jgi:hypothetical protein